MRAISASLAWANGVGESIGGQSTRATAEPVPEAGPSAEKTRCEGYPLGVSSPHGFDHAAQRTTRPEPFPAQLRQGHGAAHAPAIADGGAGAGDRPDDRARGVLRGHPPADRRTPGRCGCVVDPDPRRPRPGLCAHGCRAWRGGSVRRRGGRRRAPDARASRSERRPDFLAVPVPSAPTTRPSGDVARTHRGTTIVGYAGAFHTCTDTRSASVARTDDRATAPVRRPAPS